MSERDDGGPAFPIVTEIQTSAAGKAQMFYDGGMTLRDYFAAKAMQAFINDPWYAGQKKTADEIGIGLAADAYAVADAMLAERAKR